MARRYESPLRAAQAEHTREVILAAARGILEREGPSALTLPGVARAAGVAAPTVYRVFPTTDALLGALLEWLRPRLGMTPEQLMSVAVAALPAKNFPRFEEYAPLLRALQDTPAFNRVRVLSIPDRAGLAAERHAGELKGVGKRRLRVVTGAVYALASPVTWRWLRETWGLSATEAVEAASWGIAALLASARGEGPPKRRGASTKEKKR
jgi:AcrR family transcriptional regulator